MANRHRDSYRFERWGNGPHMAFVFCENNDPFTYNVLNVLDNNWHHLVFSKNNYVYMYNFNIIIYIF